MLIYLNLDNIRGEIWRPQCGRSSIGFLGKIATEKLPSMYFYCCKFLLWTKKLIVLLSLFYALNIILYLLGSFVWMFLSRQWHIVSQKERLEINVLDQVVLVSLFLTLSIFSRTVYYLKISFCKSYIYVNAALTQSNCSLTQPEFTSSNLMTSVAAFLLSL